MTIQWLLGWWNLMFLLPLGLALLYVGVYAVSGLTFGHADADADAGADVDADADLHTDAEVQADMHADADADAEVEGDAHADVHHGGHGHSAVGKTPLFDLLSMLIGVGRAPLSILLMVLFLTWGFFGFVANAYWYEGVRPTPVQVLTRPAPLALIGSILVTRLLAGALGKYLPTHETYASRRHELLGCVGDAIFVIDSESGTVSVRDANHDLFHVPCRVNAGHEPIAKGSKVKLVAYNGRQQVYYGSLHESVAERLA